MAQQGEKKGFIARMMEGKERDEEYARSTLPTNRWQLFWDIFKGRFSKLVIVNLLMLIFCIPLILVIVLRFLNINALGLTYPFSNWVGIGAIAVPNLQGAPEYIAFSTDVLYGALMVAAALVAAVGIAGGMYVIRNMVWTEGVFVANDFWRGIKINILSVLQSAVFYGVVLYVLMLCIDMAQWQMKLGGSVGWLTTSIVVSCVAIAIVTMMFLWMLSMGGNYKLKFFQLLRNAFLMTFALIFQNIFFAVLVLIPVLLMFLGSMFQMVGIIIFILFGLSYMLLVWLNYSQWAFDKFFESKKEGAKVNRGIYPKEGKGSGESKAVQEYQQTLEEAMSIKSDLASRPIKPITDDLQVYELPDAFSRDDLKKLRSSKQAIVEDSEQYAEEHKNDEKYVVYNAQFERMEEERKAREKEKEAADKKKKKRGKDRGGEEAK